MPADYVIDERRALVLSRGWGRITNADLVENRDALRTDPAFRPHFRQLYDFTEVSEIAVTREVLRDLRLHDPFAPGSRQAVLVGSDVAFGMARMYELLNELGSEEFHVFRDREEALRWLGL